MDNDDWRNLRIAYLFTLLVFLVGIPIMFLVGRFVVWYIELWEGWVL